MEKSPPASHWAILGAGSMGCLWAAYLSKANLPITLILKDENTLRAWKTAGGLTLQANNQLEVFNITALTISSLTRPIDFLLVTTKAHQTRMAVASIVPYLADSATLILMQNGLGVFEELNSDFPALNIQFASTTEGAYQKKRFHVVHAGRGTTHLGEFATSKTKRPKHSLKQINAHLSQCNLHIEIDDNLQNRLWSKLAVNCAINGLTVIHQCQNGKLLEIPQAREAMRGICDEVATVMTQKGIILSHTPLIQTVENVARATQYNYSSMLQDYKNNRPTEIHYINGYLIHTANELGLSCPYNQAVLKQVEQLTDYITNKTTTY